MQNAQLSIQAGCVSSVWWQGQKSEQSLRKSAMPTNSAARGLAADFDHCPGALAG